MNRSRLWVALAAGTAAFALVLAVTEPLGPGLDPDAMAYTYAARSLATRGVLLDVREDWVSADSTTPLTRWPPGFSAAIAIPVAMGASPVQGARGVIAVAAFVTVAALTFFVGAVLGAAGGLLAIVLLATPALAIVHESVLSEPLFLALLALALAAMSRERPRPLLAGVAAALASLVRYAGLGLVAAVCAGELLRAGSMRERVRRASVAGLPGLAANAWWWARASIVGGRGAVRHFSAYGQLGETLQEGAETLAGWLAPGVGLPWMWPVAVMVLAVFAALAWRGYRRAGPEEDGARRLFRAAALLLGGYCALVGAARIFADPGIPLDERILAPAMLLLSVIVVIGVALWWRAASGRARAAAGVLGLAWIAASAAVSIETARYAVRTGNDYADICWAGSPVVAWVREHGDGHALLSNADVALYFHAGRLAREAPWEIRADSQALFLDTLRARRAYVVLFDSSCAESIEGRDDLLAQLRLVPVARLETGTIWEAK